MSICLPYNCFLFVSCLWENKKKCPADKIYKNLFGLHKTQFLLLLCYLCCTFQINKNGCVTFTFKMSTFRKPKSQITFKQIMPGDKLFLNAKVKEYGTGKFSVIFRNTCYYIIRLYFLQCCNREHFLTGISHPQGNVMLLESCPLLTRPRFMIKDQMWREK